MAATVMSLVPMMAIFFLAQRYFIRSVAATGLAGRDRHYRREKSDGGHDRRSRPGPARRRRWPQPACAREAGLLADGVDD